MREILFRGKRLDNGEWVFGAYGNHTSLDAMIIDRPYLASDNDLAALGFWSVDPSTVGEYANQTDKNGVKIFEGDICRHRSIVDGEVLEDDLGDVFLYHGSWTLRDKFGYIAVGQCSPDSFEVIGNIHDNPELLEEVQHG